MLFFLLEYIKSLKNDFWKIKFFIWLNGQTNYICVLLSIQICIYVYILLLTFLFFSSGNLCNGKHPGTSGAGDNGDSNIVSATVASSSSATSHSKNISKSKKTDRNDSNNRNQDTTFTIETGGTSNRQNENLDENIDESCSVNMAPLCVSIKDRNKFCGSLPNHLDSDDVCDADLRHHTNCK